MNTATIETYRDTEVSRHCGETVEATKKIMVTNVPVASWQESALTAPDMPKVGDPFSEIDYSVVLEDHHLVVVATTGETCTVQVTLTYRLQRPDAAFPLRGSSALSSVQTIVNRDQTQITTTYQGDVQGGTVDVLVPQATIEFETTEVLDNPDTLANNWVNSINREQWRDGAAGEWMCTRAQYQLIDAHSDPRAYRFSWEFQRNFDGWNPRAYYKDKATGFPPIDLVEGEGKKTIEYYTEMDFGSKFTTG